MDKLDDSVTAQAGIQSVETGIRLLSSLAELSLLGPPPMLKILAAAAGMPPAKAHRYLVSFIRTSLVERDPVSGRYRLGAMARHIGLTAIRSLDAVRIGSPKLPQICADLEQSVALAIWAHYGPTIVSVEDPPGPVTISTKVGEIMPILSSATGRVYGAWMPYAQTRELIEKELKQNRAKKNAHAITTLQDAQRLFDEVREIGIGYVIGGVHPSINALSAPIFDFSGHITAALSVLGPAEKLDARPESPLARNLRNAADEISRELGYDPSTREK